MRKRRRDTKREKEREKGERKDSSRKKRDETEFTLV